MPSFLCQRYNRKRDTNRETTLIQTHMIPSGGLIKRSFTWDDHKGNHQNKIRLSPRNGKSYPCSFWGQAHSSTQMHPSTETQIGVVPGDLLRPGRPANAHSFGGAGKAARSCRARKARPACARRGSNPRSESRCQIALRIHPVNFEGLSGVQLRTTWVCIENITLSNFQG